MLNFSVFYAENIELKDIVKQDKIKSSYVRELLITTDTGEKISIIFFASASEKLEVHNESHDPKGL